MTDSIDKIYKFLVENTKQRGSISLILSSNTTDWVTSFNPIIELNNIEDYEIGLIDLETYYSFPNVTLDNNQFKYFNGATNKTITIPVGSYEITALNAAIQLGMQTNGDWDSANNAYYINIYPNISTLKSVIEITNPSYTVDFTINNSLRELLGFSSVILTNGVNNSQNIINILTINSILVNCSIVGSSYINGNLNPIIYSFFPNVGPGYKIIERPQRIVYLPITTRNIMQIRLWLTDQNGKTLDLRGETITTRLEIKKK